MNAHVRRFSRSFDAANYFRQKHDTFLDKQRMLSQIKYDCGYEENNIKECVFAGTNQRLLGKTRYCHAVTNKAQKKFWGSNGIVFLCQFCLKSI